MLSDQCHSFATFYEKFVLISKYHQVQKTDFICLLLSDFWYLLREDLEQNENLLTYIDLSKVCGIYSGMRFAAANVVSCNLSGVSIINTARGEMQMRPSTSLLRHFLLNFCVPRGRNLPFLFCTSHANEQNPAAQRGTQNKRWKFKLRECKRFVT